MSDSEVQDAAGSFAMWNADPTAVALEASAWYKNTTDHTDVPWGFCLEVGRRLLLAELQFSEWTLRRVEKINLDRDRTISRNITVEFAIRPDAPTFVGADGRRLRLVPLSMMNRRTLVNLDLRDHNDISVPMPGIRTKIWKLRRVGAALGLVPIRIRLQVPGAENAASYHFEMTAPPGVEIVEATLLAGRPNDPGRSETVDSIAGHVSTVGLHALEIPNGSLCRVQVDLRPPARGWLATMLVACLAICAVLGTVAYQWRYRNPDWGQDEITNVVLLLVTTSAAVIALVAQREGGDVAARFVSGARVLGTVATVLPIAVAVFLVYGNSGTHPAERFFVLFLCLASAVPAGVIGKAWWNSVKADRHKAEKASPWDMADHEKARRQRQDETPKVRNFHDNVRHYGFDTAAIGVRSAEAWHEYYGWDDGAQLHAVTSLQPHVWPVPRPACAGSQSNCARRKACPRLITDGH